MPPRRAKEMGAFRGRQAAPAGASGPSTEGCGSRGPNQQQATLPPAVMSLRSIMLSYSAPSLGIEPILSCIEPVMLSWCKPAWRFTLRIATFHI
jgi:hypothetical protein